MPHQSVDLLRGNSSGLFNRTENPFQEKWGSQPVLLLRSQGNSWHDPLKDAVRCWKCFTASFEHRRRGCEPCGISFRQERGGPLGKRASSMAAHFFDTRIFAVSHCPSAEPKTGFEPVTYRLRIDCTTPVLLRRLVRTRRPGFLGEDSCCQASFLW